MSKDQLLADTLARMNKPGTSNEDTLYLQEIYKALTKDDAKILMLQELSDNSYRERNKLAALVGKAALAMGYDAWRGHDDSESDAWRNVLFIQLPKGQVSFHIGINDFSLIADFELDEKKKWDGHDNEVKWVRVLESEFLTMMPIKKATEWLNEVKAKYRQALGGLAYLHGVVKGAGFYETLGCEDRIVKAIAGGDAKFEEQQVLKDVLQYLWNDCAGKDSPIENPFNLVSLITDHIRQLELCNAQMSASESEARLRHLIGEQKRREIFTALEQLVTLKEYKDTIGKTDEYERKQPLAWDEARKVLAAAEPILA